MADKKRKSVSDTPLAKKRTIKLETKMEIIKRQEKGETLSQIARAYGVNHSTIGTILTDKTRILDHVKGSELMQSTITTKKCTIIISDMEKLLTLWTEDQNQHTIPVSLMLIQEKAHSLF
jgi:hypothetical protein